MIHTARLTLHFCTADHLARLIEGAESFQAAYGWPVMEGYLEFPEALPWMLANLEKHPAPWGSYLYIHRHDHTLLGMGGYKGAPDAVGMVEIGYGVAHAYRNQGYASEAARALLDYAFTHPEVQRVWAHTLPEVNYSTKVLEKCGMHCLGSIHDDEEGEVWRWAIRRP